MYINNYYSIKQHDYKDCGCACLATICKQYGLKYPISKIREIAGTDKLGTSALGVIHKISEKEIIVADPAKGIVKYKPSDFFNI